MAKLKVKKGDYVVVLAGKDKGKKGNILKVFPKEQKVVVADINMVKRHAAPKQGNPGGITVQAAAIHVSNVSLVDPKTGEATRIGFKFLEDGSKVRVAKASGEVIS